MNKESLYKLSYGLFILTAKEGDKDNGCIIDTAIQAASGPEQISICVNKTSCTHDMVMRTGAFTVSVLSVSASFELFKLFGFRSGKYINKFEAFDKCERGENGIYYITEGTNAYISVKVTKTEDLGSHTMFIGEITDMDVLSETPSATYDYYLKNIKPKEENVMAKYVCPVCGYIHEGDEAPAECPVCHVSGEKFKLVEGEITLAAEHEYGIYAKLVKNNDKISAEDKQYIFDQLMANFKGECSEVGMYLCMARIAHREGYPEIGLYWEKAAYEEAEHAAKFAEILGTDLEPNMKAATKDNLAWRVDCEFGATQGKAELADLCDKYGLTAIEDTVREMAKDEARHGKALKGMLDRYFK